MKLRHRQTGEILELTDYLPDAQGAKEIASVYRAAAAPPEEKIVPPGIIRLKVHTGEIISVSKITQTRSPFPYDKQIRIHLNLPPFIEVIPQNKSSVWSVIVNGMEWSIGDQMHNQVIHQFKWSNESGWWALTDGIYAIHLAKIFQESNFTVKHQSIAPIVQPEPPKSFHQTYRNAQHLMQMFFLNWFKKLIVN